MKHDVLCLKAKYDGCGHGEVEIMDAGVAFALVESSKMRGDRQVCFLLHQRSSSPYFEAL